MKLLSKTTLMVLLSVVSLYGYIASCTHDDIVPPAPANPIPEINRGDAVMLPGSMTAGDTTQWKLDKVHSSVLWSSAYKGAAGLLTGRFNHFGMHDVIDPKMINYTPPAGQPLLDTSWAFYENDPSKTYFNGWVEINTSNTGEPGRDTGCNIGGMGTVKITSGVFNLTSENIAKIKSTKVEFDPYSNDYIVNLDLTWHGLDTLADGTPNMITKSIVGKLKYIPKSPTYSSTGTFAYNVFGLQLTFQFNCRDFKVTSTSIGDAIDIECNMNFNNR